MSNSNHIPPNLPQVVYEGDTLVEHERILQVDLQHLKNRSFKRFLIMYKDYYDDEASRELENKCTKTYPNFAIDNNDLI